MEIISILILIAGILFLIKGSDYFVDGASRIAKSLKIPTLIIGLTLVSIGTSAPELSVSITSALQKANDLSFGNVIGSNVFNVLVVIGASAIFTPMIVDKAIVKRDIPVLLFIYIVLFLFAFVINFDTNGKFGLSLYESIIILSMFFIYTIYLIIDAKKNKVEDSEDEELDLDKASKKQVYVNGLISLVLIVLFSLGYVFFKEELNITMLSFVLSLVLTVLYFIYTLIKHRLVKDNKVPLIVNILLVLAGLCAIVIGGDFVVSSASVLALRLGMAENLIGLTIVAIGTSLPELMTSVTAAKKGENDIAIGNAIGSSIFNIVLILGVSSSIYPMVSNLTINHLIDVVIMTTTVVLTLFFILRYKKITRTHGIIMIIYYIAYTAYIIARSFM